jgi:hypothetical protein
MPGIENRLRKMETAISDIGYDDQIYIDAIISHQLGDNGKALDTLPPYKGSSGRAVAIVVKGISRAKNISNQKGN